MKNFIIYGICVIIILISSFLSLYAQTNACGFNSYYSGNPNPDDYFGGWYKPSRTDIGGAPGNSYFPVLIVFVQFKNERGDSTTTNPDALPAGKPPNYLDSLIDTTRRTSSNWWDAYNSFKLADYWHEFSRTHYFLISNKNSNT